MFTGPREVPSSAILAAPPARKGVRPRLASLAVGGKLSLRAPADEHEAAGGALCDGRNPTEVLATLA